jgi:hypothetical protein
MRDFKLFLDLCKVFAHLLKDCLFTGLLSLFVAIFGLFVGQFLVVCLLRLGLLLLLFLLILLLVL